MATNDAPTPMAQPAPILLNNQINELKGKGLTNVTNQPATKEFVYNETGNIFVASTLNNATGQGSISANALKAFEEVSVFFSAMTKAISTTTNPETQTSYSLYDYDAINKIISNSGLFSIITQEEIDYQTSSWGVSLNIEFIEALIGFAAPSPDLITIFSSLIRSMGKEAITMSNKSSSSKGKVGTIVFVCEYLLGAVSITSLVLYADVSENSHNFAIGACFTEHNESLTWHLNKDTYLFIPPSFIQEAQSMNEAMANPDYLALINTLRGNLGKAPTAAPSATTDSDTSKTSDTSNTSS